MKTNSILLSLMNSAIYSLNNEPNIVTALCIICVFSASMVLLIKIDEWVEEIAKDKKS
jgi:hypothetical protein